MLTHTATLVFLCVAVLHLYSKTLSAVSAGERGVRARKMFGLSEKTRWFLFIVGLLFVVLGVLEHHDMLDEYPIIKIVVFPYIWVLGCALMFVAYGFDDDSQKNSGSGGVDGAPGLGEKKSGPFGGGGYWESGDGSSGGGGD